jgi:hypothetical protein
MGERAKLDEKSNDMVSTSAHFLAFSHGRHVSWPVFRDSGDQDDVGVCVVSHDMKLVDGVRPLIGEGKCQGQLGFDKSFPAKAKPQPKRLQPKPQHVAGNKILFTAVQ